MGEGGVDARPVGWEGSHPPSAHGASIKCEREGVRKPKEGKKKMRYKRRKWKRDRGQRKGRIRGEVLIYSDAQ